MKRRRHQYNRLVAQYNRYRRKLSRIEQGISSYCRKDLLIKRLTLLQERLLSYTRMSKVAGMSAALSAGMILGTSNLMSAQSLNLKTENVLQLAHIESDAKPALVDFDADGDMDLFIGGNITTDLDSNAVGIAYYQNQDGVFRGAVSPFPSDLGTGTILEDTARISPAFIDYDDDGDMDCFAGLSNGTIFYYRNDDGAMVLVQGSENPFDGIRVGDSDNASPTFVDVDGDGDMDAVIGKYSGSISYYKNTDGLFVDQTNGADDPNPFADISVTESSTPSFVDWDADGDMDLFVGNKSGEMAYFQNNDGVYEAVDAADNPFTGLSLPTYIAAAFADLDDDGDLDVVMGESYGDVLFLRNDGGTLNIIERNTLGIEQDGFGSVTHAFIDIDGDADMDLTHGTFYGNIVLHTNSDGKFTIADPNPLDTSVAFADFNSAPAWADIDQDGDVDFFLGTYSQNIRYFSNTDGVFTEVIGEGNPFNEQDAGQNENIAFIDADGDGDLDAYVGNKIGEIHYFVNTDGVFTESAIDNPFEDISFEIEGQPNHPVKPAFGDIDGDGDMDALFGMIDGNIRSFENTGDAYAELIGEDNPFDGMDFGRAATPTFGDIDGDGVMDLLVGNAAGMTFHFENGESTSARVFAFSQETNAYPSPTPGNVRLEMPWSKKSTTIQIYSASGQLMSQTKTSGQSAEITMYDFPSGLYIVRLIGAEGAASKRIMKQ